MFIWSNRLIGTTCIYMFENIRVALNAKYAVQGIKRRYQTECGVLTV